MEALAGEGRICAPDEVLFELKRGGDDVYNWALNVSTMFIEPTPDIQQVVASIVKQYPEFVPEISKDGVWADPYVIATAKILDAIVVTGEKPVGPNARRPKIPNVCIGLSVKWIDFLQLIRLEEWHF
jgi:hypothetical protein